MNRKDEIMQIRRQYGSGYHICSSLVFSIMMIWFFLVTFYVSNVIPSSSTIYTILSYIGTTISFVFLILGLITLYTYLEPPRPSPDRSLYERKLLGLPDIPTSPIISPAQTPIRTRPMSPYASQNESGYVSPIKKSPDYNDAMKKSLTSSGTISPMNQSKPYQSYYDSPVAKNIYTGANTFSTPSLKQTGPQTGLSFPYTPATSMNLQTPFRSPQSVGGIQQPFRSPISGPNTHTPYHSLLSPGSRNTSPHSNYYGYTPAPYRSPISNPPVPTSPGSPSYGYTSPSNTGYQPPGNTVYQSPTRYGVYRSVQAVKEVPKKKKDSYFDDVKATENYEKLRLTDNIESYSEQMRMWISNNIIQPLVSDIEFVEKELNQNPQQMNQLMWNQQNAALLAKKNRVEGFLNQISTDREYLIRRLKSLAKKSYLGDFVWNGGGTETKKKWTTELVTDTQIVITLFNAYMDMIIRTDEFNFQHTPFSHRHFKCIPDFPSMISFQSTCIN
eukprot:TRINITY_DN7795_c0_g2_i1.p1 TRINITY_DN7795_c0_g2~~TRINITY_DN7795_c0_g2_i1.p1  ORF type:complete len:500 (-),score=61.87 TRINITY_DN7795_c0_g2_i1:9-1508(-)